MRDLCYVMSKRAQRQLEIFDGQVGNEPGVKLRGFSILKAPLIFTLVPPSPRPASPMVKGWIQETSWLCTMSFVPMGLADHGPMSDSVKVTVVAGGTTGLGHSATSKQGRGDEPRVPQRDSGRDPASLRHRNKSAKPNHARSKSALETTFLGFAGIFTAGFTSFKAFAAFVGKSEGFLYLPCSAVAFLLNSLLLPNLRDCHLGAAWASAELPACARRERQANPIPPPLASS